MTITTTYTIYKTDLDANSSMMTIEADSRVAPKYDTRNDLTWTVSPAHLELQRLPRAGDKVHVTRIAGVLNFWVELDG